MIKNILTKIIMLSIVVIGLSACSSDELNVASGSESADDEYEYTYTMTISLDVYIFEDIEDLADDATHIIRGEILDQRVEWLDMTLSREATEQILIEEGYLDGAEIEYRLQWYDFEPQMELVTISRIRVLETFQGDHDIDDVIEVFTVGGIYENQQWVLEDAVELEVGSELVLFLASWEFAGLPYALTSHIQSVYYIPNEIEAEYITEAVGEYLDLELENPSELCPLIITIEDLVDIAAENDLIYTIEELTDFTEENELVDFTEENELVDFTEENELVDFTEENELIDFAEENELVDFTEENDLLDE